MDFYEPITQWDIMRSSFKQDDRISSYTEFYDMIFKSLVSEFGMDAIVNDRSLSVAYKRAFSEERWWGANRPYYKVWPKIIPYLTRLRHADIPCAHIKTPMDCIAFRFPKQDNPLEFDGGQARTIIVDKTMNEIIMWIDFGEVDSGGIPILTYKVMDLEQPTVEKALTSLKEDTNMKEGLQIPRDKIMDCVRVVIGVFLLSEDAEDGLIEPDVLSKDKHKFARTKDEKFVKKAIRRGKLGWNVGGRIEVSPHWRSPSPLALYWVGPGRKKPVYRYRRGTVVKRNIAKKLPTGHMQEDAEQDSP